MKPTPNLSGQSVTLLADGRWLRGGGEGVAGTVSTLSIEQGGLATILPVSMLYARSGQSATVLADSTVLIVGGTAPDGTIVAVAELFDPASNTVHALALTAVTARTLHSATLLTSGLVLIAGGQDAAGQVLATAELWDIKAGTVQAVNSPLEVARYSQEAALLSSGEAWLQHGFTSLNEPAVTGELYEPRIGGFAGPVTPTDPRIASVSVEAGYPPAVAESVPASNALDVSIDTQIAIRFNRPLPIAQLDASTLTLIGPSGVVSARASGAEGGMLAFVTPDRQLLPATTYTLFVTGVKDQSGQALPSTSVRFTTHQIAAQIAPLSVVSNPLPASAVAQTHRNTGIVSPTATSVAKKTAGPAAVVAVPRLAAAPAVAAATSEDWIPQAQNRQNAWRILGLSGDPPVALTAKPPASLQASAGQTALAGLIERLNGLPLAGVTVSVGATATTTDALGRFILRAVATGPQLLEVDGTGLLSGGRHYTKHYLQVSVAVGITSVLPYVIYLPRVDPATEVALSSPAAQDIILTHPAIPGLEVHIPKGAVLRDHDGTIVTKVSITPIPVDRAPYPSPTAFSVYFTLQPGGAYVDGDPSKAIQIIYPNYQGLPAHSSIALWNYDPDTGGWAVYGHGNVSADGKTIVPDESVGFRQIMTFGFGAGPVYSNQNQLPNPGPKQGGCTAGDPVDCATGLFLHNVTDMVVRDVIPISVSRLYRQNDNFPHAFGTGNNLSYAMWLNFPVGGSTNPITLVLADGGQINYYPVSGANVYPYVNTDSPTMFQGSSLAPAPGTGQWLLTLKDGTVLQFQQSIPNQLTSITDRNGNQVNITVVGNLVTQVSSPNGRYLQFFYDPYYRVNQVVDSAGRSSSYTYDSSGRLATAKDADGNTESYGYDPVSNGMNLVTDKRGNAMVKNLFDANGRVSQQTLADGAIWKFAYLLNSAGAVTQTTVTDPRNYVTQETFNPSGYLTQDIVAMGAAEQQTFTMQRGGSNEPVTVTDPLGRQTSVAYDSFGDPISLTLLNGTAGAVTYTYAYDPTFHQMTSYTDPLGHVTAIDHDARGNIVSVTDALNHASGFVNNPEGLPTQVTDPLGHAIQIGYHDADLASVTDALSRTTNLLTDPLGRLISINDPLGNKTQYGFDAMDRLTSATDALSEITNATYDPNGNLLTVKDSRSVTQTYTYDTRNRRQTYKDPLGVSESYTYDGLSNLSTYTDRKGQVTSITYDGIERPTLITYQDASTIAITWDGGNRATKFVDSLNGTISRQYDLLDRMTQEATPQGTVNYTYDAANRRATMTVAGQTVVNYTFDAANRLTLVAQGSLSVGYGYDNANRRTGLTYPNSVVGTFTFDNANELTAISYAKGATQIGTLGYGYDLDGRRTSVTGTLAGFATPSYSPAPTYDGANRLTNWNGTSLGYDANGNLTTFGATTYTWNARNQLTATSAGTATFSYDMFGRRTSAVISGATTPYLYDGWNPVTINGNFMLAGQGLDDIQASVSSGSATSFLRDGVDSTVAQSNSSATTTATYDYSPYGDTTVSGTSASALQYTGRENDAATGLYYFRSRYYSPQLSRFISQDPMELAGGTNFYSYALDNPVSFIDPLGLCTLQIGITLNVQLGIINLNGTYGLVFDTAGNFGWYNVLGFGAGSGANVFGGLNLDISNGDTIADLANGFANTSAALGDGIAGGLDAFVGAGSHGQTVSGAGYSVGVGVGAAYATGISNTGIHPIW